MHAIQPCVNPNGFRASFVLSSPRMRSALICAIDKTMRDEQTTKKHDLEDLVMSHSLE